MKFFIKDFFNKYDQIRRKLKKSLMENFIFYAVSIVDMLSTGHLAVVDLRA